MAAADKLRARIVNTNGGSYLASWGPMSDERARCSSAIDTMANLSLLYWASRYSGDGSYSLSVSFAVGSDPDLNTVNVNNRVNQAIALLPPEVQRLGVTTKKQSSALLQVVAVYSPNGSRDALFLSNFATITLLDTLRRARFSPAEIEMHRRAAALSDDLLQVVRDAVRLPLGVPDGSRDLQVDRVRVPPGADEGRHRREDVVGGLPVAGVDRRAGEDVVGHRDPGGALLLVERLDHNLGKIHDLATARFRVTRYARDGKTPGSLRR